MAYQLSNYLQEISSDQATLLYHSKNGNNLVIDGGAIEVYHMLKAGDTPEMIRQTVEGEQLEEFIDSLINKHFLIDGEEVIPSYIIPDKEYIKDGKMLEHLRLNVTETCNLRCSYCYERVSEVWNQKRIMGWDTAKKAMDQFLFYIQKNEKKKVSVRFFGGEPMLNWELVEKCMDYIKNELSDDIQVNYIINTNGTLIDDERARFLAENNIAISLSLDGVKDIHDKFRVYPNGAGSFEVVSSNMNHLIANQCRFNLSVVCTEETLKRLPDFIDFVSDKQTECEYRIPVCFNFVQITDDEGQLSDDEKIDLLVAALKYANEKEVQSFGGLTHFVLEKLLHNYIGTYCGGSGSEFSISPAGDIFPCSGLDVNLGNVDSFGKVFQSETYRNLCKRKSGNIVHCRDCEIECFCSGGCVADVVSKSDQANGYFDGYIEGQEERLTEKATRPYCEQQKKMFSKLVNYYLLSQ